MNIMVKILRKMLSKLLRKKQQQEDLYCEESRRTLPVVPQVREASSETLAKYTVQSLGLQHLQ